MSGTELNPAAWEGRCTHSESTMHQLSPFIGKMKSSMAKELVETYTKEGERVLDPFSGSGTIPLEAAMTGREAVAIDNNPYSITLTKAKLNPPKKEKEAKEKAKSYLNQINYTANIEDIPEWVKEFFHNKTLSGIVELTGLLRENNEDFLMACLMGILHHQRPGFLSHPAGHLRPYLKEDKFPREDHPERYEFREIEPRLISKIERAYRRFSGFTGGQREVREGDCIKEMAEFEENSFDAIITSPPYMDKLDYGRDNRLRLFFLGVRDYKDLESPPSKKEEYRSFLSDFLNRAEDIVSPGGSVIFVLGESKRSGSFLDTSEILLESLKSGGYKFELEELVHDRAPVGEVNAISGCKETIMCFERDEG